MVVIVRRMWDMGKLKQKLCEKEEKKKGRGRYEI